jgi:soluble lytic murein transglycosylase-like protein
MSKLLYASSVLAILIAPLVKAEASSYAASSITPPIARPFYTPPPKPSDWDIYASAFELQQKAKWSKADRLLADIDDPILMGHILYQRYMHPTAYRAKWTELRDWLINYKDQPGAWRVYKLAQKRKPRGVSMPSRPPSRVYQGTSASARSPLFSRRAARSIRREVNRLVRRERPSQALKYISYRSNDRQLSAAETDYLKAKIARSYYIEGKPKDSLKLAIKAGRSWREVPIVDWHAGLASWRLKNFDLAILHFERLANNEATKANMRTSAQFWLGRSYHQLGEVVKAEAWLQKAATGGNNFYALLARQIVFGTMTINWQQLQIEPKETIGNYPPVTRSIALAKAKQPELAELELLYLQERSSDTEARAILDLAKAYNFPAVELAIATRLDRNTIDDRASLNMIEGRYPTLDNEEIGELNIDRALLFALIRQESRFKARAKSHAGARGLMQIMPRTAAFVTGDRSLARTSGRDKLLDSDLNLEIGQKYLGMLLGERYFDNNLIYALAGYNAGPGNLKRWRRELKDMNDPLLFIESISAPETRKYVQHVLENFWIYRSRLNQEATSLRLLAAETWPSYIAQDLSKEQKNMQASIVDETQTNKLAGAKRPQIQVNPSSATGQ